MTAKTAPAKPHPLTNMKFLSLEDQRRFGRTRYVTVQFVRDERRIHDRKKRPYAHCVSIVTAYNDPDDARLLGRPRECVISVARLSKASEYKPVDERGNDIKPSINGPIVSREQVEAHQVSDGNGGALPPCPGGHPGQCHEAALPPSSRDEIPDATSAVPADQCPA